MNCNENYSILQFILQNNLSLDNIEFSIEWTEGRKNKKKQESKIKLEQIDYFKFVLKREITQLNHTISLLNTDFNHLYQIQSDQLPYSNLYKQLDQNIIPTQWEHFMKGADFKQFMNKLSRSVEELKRVLTDRHFNVTLSLY